MLAMMQVVIANQMAKFAENHEIQMANLTKIQGSQFAELQCKLLENKEMQENQFAELRSKLGESQEQTANQIADLTEHFTERFNGISDQIGERVRAEVSAATARLDEHIAAYTQESVAISKRIGAVAERLDASIEINNARLAECEAQVEVKLREQEGKMRSLHAHVESVVDETKGKVAEFCDGLKDAVIEVEKKGAANCKKIARLDGKVIAEVARLDGDIKNLQATTEASIQKQGADFKQIIRESVDGLRDEMQTPAGVCSDGHGSRVHLSPPQNLGFSGAKNEHPCEFLRRMEDYFTLSNAVPNRLKAKFAQQYLFGAALQWSLSMSRFPETYEEFREKFLKRFWGEETKFTYERRLLEKRWYPKMGISYLDYAVGKIAAFRLCDPSISDNRLIWIITSQFPERIQNSLNSARLENIHEFQDLLGKFDQARISGNNETENDRPPPQNNQRWPRREGDAGRNWGQHDRGPPREERPDGHSPAEGRGNRPSEN